MKKQNQQVILSPVWLYAPNTFVPAEDVNPPMQMSLKQKENGYLLSTIYSYWSGATLT